VTPTRAGRSGSDSGSYCDPELSSCDLGNSPWTAGLPTPTGSRTVNPNGGSDSNGCAHRTVPPNQVMRFLCRSGEAERRDPNGNPRCEVYERATLKMLKQYLESRGINRSQRRPRAKSSPGFRSCRWNVSSA